MFKAKAFLDLSLRKANGEHVDSRDIKKHKNDILKIAMEFVLEKAEVLPQSIHIDMKNFLEKVDEDPFEHNLLKEYGLSNDDVLSRLEQLYF